MISCLFQGTTWEYVDSDQPLTSISCGPFRRVWAIGRNGCAYWRLGIHADKVDGEKWICVEPPAGCHLKYISTGQAGIWSVDQDGKLHVRREVTSMFPEGTHWQTLTVDPSVTSKFFNN